MHSCHTNTSSRCQSPRKKGRNQGFQEMECGWRLHASISDGSEANAGESWEAKYDDYGDAWILSKDLDEEKRLVDLFCVASLRKSHQN